MFAAVADLAEIVAAVGGLASRSPMSALKDQNTQPARRSEPHLGIAQARALRLLLGIANSAPTSAFRQ